MIPKISLIAVLAGVALVLAAPSWGDSWAVDRQQQSAPAVPDVFERAVARGQSTRSTVGGGVAAAKPADAIAAGAYPDAFERAVARAHSVRNPVGDDHFRLNPTVLAVSTAVPGSGSEIEWPQVAVGFGVGLLLAFGLFLGGRLVSHRELAH